MNDSEHALISLIAQDPEWTRLNASQLSPILFDYEPHRIMYEAITECGHEWDMMSVTSVLRRRNCLDKIGGPAGVSEFWTSFQIKSMAPHHLKTVREHATLRRSLSAHKEAQVRLEMALTQGTEDAAGLLAGIRHDLEGSAQLPGRRLKRLTSAQVMDLVVNEIEERAKNPGQIKGITTGLPSLDKKTHGLQEGHLWVIAGGPGDGKSALMQNLLEAAARTGVKNAVYQLEMPIEEQAMRFLASDSMVDSGNLMTGLMTHAEQIAIAASIKRLKKSGTAYVDTDNASAEDILADIEQSDYRVVMVDYLQLLDVTQGKNETRELAISRIAKDLKSLAKRKRITILTGSQLNDDGKLRESRAIGQHADKVLFVQKVEVDDEPDMTRRTLILEKNRGGPPKAKIPLGFAGASFRFSESTHQEPREEQADWTESMTTDKRRKRR
jgi:replicative DNA helicase